jgi:hypothetical protein
VNLLKKKELTDKEKTLELMKQLHNVRVIPRSFIPQLETFMEGEYDYFEEKYVDVYTWDEVYYGYRSIKKEIEWAMQNRNFNNSLNKFRYTFAILKERLPDVAEHRRKTNKLLEANTNITYTDEEVTRFSKSKSKVDISRFL